MDESTIPTSKYGCQASKPFKTQWFRNSVKILT